jgi:hypothetical protein
MVWVCENCTFKNKVGEKVCEICTAPHNERKQKGGRKGKQVVQYDLKRKILAYFNTITVASQVTGVKTATISNCCRDSLDVHGNYWDFYTG